MAFTFVHAADLHLDSPFRSLRSGGVGDRLGQVLQQSTFGALTGIVDLCLREKAAFLLLAGDLFDAKDRSVRARLALRRELERLDAAGIRTFVVHGNHDPLSGDGAIALPPSVKVFGPEWEEALVALPGGEQCRVQGISYPQEKVSENLSARFARRGDEFTIGLLHANLAGASGSGGHANYSPCTLEELGERELDYWALGHVHTRAQYTLSNGGVAAFPGNPQGRHANETGERGCLVVRVPSASARGTLAAKALTVDFVAVDKVRWHRLEVDVSAIADIGEVADRVEEEVDGSVGSTADRLDAHAMRILLVGRGGPRAELAKPDALVELQAELAGRLARRTPPVVLESLEDRTAAELDLARIRAEGGLPAEVLAIADEARRHPVALEPLWDGDLRLLDGRLKRLGIGQTREEWEPLLERARERAMELLVDAAESRPESRPEVE